MTTTPPLLFFFSLFEQYLRPLGKLKNLEQNRNSTGNLPNEQTNPRQVCTDVDRSRGIISLLHGGDHGGGEGPEDDESGSGVEVGSREEFPGAGVGVEWSLWWVERRNEKISALNQTAMFCLVPSWTNITGISKVKQHTSIANVVPITNIRAP